MPINPRDLITPCDKSKRRTTKNKERRKRELKLVRKALEMEKSGYVGVYKLVPIEVIMERQRLLKEKVDREEAAKREAEKVKREAKAKEEQLIIRAAARMARREANRY